MRLSTPSFFTCEWDTGNKKTVHHVHNKSANVGASVTYDVSKIDRKNPNGKVTGFSLTALTAVDESRSGSIPEVGGDCPATGNDAGTDSAVIKKITAVDVVSSVSTESLTADYAAGGLSAVIWPPPPAPVL